MKRRDDTETERWLRTQLEFVRDQLRDSFVQAPAAMALLSGPDHRFVFANGAYLKMVGRAETQIIGKTAREALPELVDQGFLDLLNRVYQTGEPFVASAREANLTRARKDETVFVDFTYSPMRNLEGEIEGILFQGVDVTDQVLAREQLEKRVSERTRELKRAERSLRALNHRFMLAQDEERRRLALELHDSAGQLIAILQWKLVSLQESAPHAAPVAADIAACRSIAEDLSREIRTIAHLLYPPLLDEAGLAAALNIYVEGMRERSGMTVSLEIDSNLGRLARDLETAVFRVIQEALTNIHRHARTSEAFVTIHRDATLLRVEIEDRGRGIAGFTSLEAQKTGVGLRGMRERVRQMAGQFELRSGEGGTTVKATFPVHNTTKRDTSYRP